MLIRFMSFRTDAARLIDMPPTLLRVVRVASLNWPAPFASDVGPFSLAVASARRSSAAFETVTGPQEVSCAARVDETTRFEPTNDKALRASRVGMDRVRRLMIFMWLPAVRRPLVHAQSSRLATERLCAGEPTFGRS